MKFGVRTVIYTFLAVLFAHECYGHSMYQSAVLLDFAGHDVNAELQLPLERMGAAFGIHIQSPLSPEDQARFADYVLRGFFARSKDGQRFTTQLARPLTINQLDGAPYLVAHLTLTMPALQLPEVFEIQNSVLLDRIPSQVSLVSIRSDWKSSIFANDPQMIGVLRGSSRSVVVNRTGRSWFNGFGSVFKLGVRHIAEGTDHLLFLLALLIPAPLLFSRSRWRGPADASKSLIRIVKIVTAFTVGHSITLALAALGLVHVPSRPIEVLIAVSILFSAIHALRPLFPGREALVAAFFGLIHGLAFATTLSELGLGRWERVASIFGFNLGIEAMQLAVVIAILPSLLLLSRTRAYPAFRIFGALFAVFASLGWIAERLFGKHTSVDVVVDSVAHHGIWIAASLFAGSLLLWRFSNLSLQHKANLACDHEEKGRYRNVASTTLSSVSLDCGCHASPALQVHES